MFPTEVPEWLWLILGALGAFAAKELWPAVRGWLDADFKARRERTKAVTADIEMRAIKSQETIAASLDRISNALDLFARSNTAMAFQLDEMRRDLNSSMEGIYRWLEVPSRRAADRLTPRPAVVPPPPRADESIDDPTGSDAGAHPPR